MKPLPGRFALCLLAALLLPDPGARAAVWTTDGTDSLLQQPEDLDFRDVRISTDGTISLAPRRAEADIIPTEEAAVWQAARDRDGNLYLATGHLTRLFRGRNLDARATAIFTGGDGEILALAADATGDIWFGTTPEGRLYRVRDAEPEPVATLGTEYVFTLLSSPDGSMLCATGDQGRLLRVRPGGETATVFIAGASHLTSLCWLEPGARLLAGTSPSGIVYLLNFRPGYAAAQATVLYDTPLDEVRAITPGPDGRVFIAANPASDGNEADADPAVFCVDRDGLLRWQWSCPDSAIYGLAWRDGLLHVATGSAGIIYGLDTLGSASVLTRAEEPQVLFLTPDRSGALLFGTGNPGRLYQFGPDLADSGYIISPPHDCGNPARFGRLDQRSEIPQGSSLALDLRSGNSEDPDSTWSAWSASPPPGRFVQWRARFRSTFPGRTPVLRRVDLYYTTANLAPRVTQLGMAEVPAAEARRGNSKPQRDITWETTDPEDDSLTYELYIRPEGANWWRRLGLDLAEKRYELDTRTLPDGWYELRLVASDRAERPVQTALAAEKTSAPVLIDNTPPVIRDLNIAGSTLTFSVADALSPIIACRTSANAGDWIPAEPADGIFDSPTERFSVPLKLSPGVNTIAVWATDAQGNVTTARTTSR